MIYTDEEIEKIIKFCGKRPTSSVSQQDGSVKVDYDILLSYDKQFQDQVGYSTDLYIDIKSFRRILKEKEFQEAYIERTPGVHNYKEMYILLFADRKELPTFLNGNESHKNLALLRIRKHEQTA